MIRGPSGSGKSDLALRCIALGPNALIAQAAVLVADDQVAVELLDGRLIAHAPAALAGKFEVRGIGIVSVNHVASADVTLLVDLVAAGGAVERLPDPVLTGRLCGISLPVLRLSAFEASAAAKLLVALASRYGQSEA